MEIQTERLRVVPLNTEQLKLLLENIPQLEKELSCTYKGEEIKGELLDIIKQQIKIMSKDKDNYLWLTFWQFILKSDNSIIGSACFKGLPDNDGKVEIGYGINLAYQRHGYTTEAVKAMCKWVLNQPGVNQIIAETDKSNIASHKVLKKCGMKKYKEVEKFYWWCLKKSMIN